MVISLLSANMAATLFFPPPTLPSSNPHHLPDEGEDDEDDSPILTTHHLLHHSTTEVGDGEDHNVANTSPENSPHNHEVEEEEDEEEEVDEDEEEGVDGGQPSGNNPNSPSNTLEEDQPVGGTGVDLGTLIGRRITLKPRRTLSLSPTPARAGDMMARNLRAARWLDFTNEDDDDGLYQHSDSDTEVKKKTLSAEETSVGGIGKVRVTRRGGSLTLGAMTGLSRDFLASRRGSSSMKRPLEVTLPCQEIQYLDISYQKVGIHSVQFSPIPRKKIAYHPVPYHAIHYCDVPYLGERPVKRKPPA